jgi:hypothetical protein
MKEVAAEVFPEEFAEYSRGVQFYAGGEAWLEPQARIASGANNPATGE